MEIQIDGSQINILEEFFNNLSLSDQKKIFTSAYRKATKPLIAAAKASVPRRTGQLAGAIGTMNLRDEIAILAGAKRPQGSHAHLTENGTVERFRKSGGSTGKMTGTHWFEHAYNATEDGVFDTIEQEWHTEIDKFIQKVNRRLK